MDPRQIFADQRLSGFCVYCGGPSETRDHVPSRVLLDDPFPCNLPVVDCCHDCNGGFSIHEEYLACFVACVLAGSTRPDEIARTKVARILRDRPPLAARIGDSLAPSSDDERIWIPEMDRVRKVILKLARGHIAYELSLPRLEDPVRIECVPLSLMAPDDIEAFLNPKETPFWPEIGSRAFIRLCRAGTPRPAEHWQIVQADRYQYLVSQSNGDFVRILLSNYLACEARWD
jgi:hypothetical protein